MPPRAKRSIFPDHSEIPDDIEFGIIANGEGRLAVNPYENNPPEISDTCYRRNVSHRDGFPAPDNQHSK